MKESFRAHRSKHAPKLGGGAHAHDCPQLLHIAKGCAQVQTDDGSWIVPPHRALWIPARKSHLAFSNRAAETNNLYFPKKFQNYFSRSHCFVFSVTPLLRELFETIVKLDPKDFNSSFGNLFFELVVEIVSRQSIKQNDFFLPAPQDPRLTKLILSLTEDYSVDVELSRLCQKVGLSLRTAQRLFQKETGMSITRWLTNHRIFTSTEDLAQGISITEIALKFGFESVASYSHSFKKIMGFSPKAFLTA